MDISEEGYYKRNMHTCETLTYLAGLKNTIRKKVRVESSSRANADSLISKLNVLAVSISLRINSNGLDAELLTSTEDTTSDLTTVSNEELIEELSFNSSRVETNSGVHLSSNATKSSTSSKHCLCNGKSDDYKEI
jgi:hypothetical protein